MSMRWRKKLSALALPVVIGLSAALALGGGNAYADPHRKDSNYKNSNYKKSNYQRPPQYHGKTVVVHRPPHYGRTVVNLPPRYHTVRWHGTDYYYHGGGFYQRGPSGFITVSAPIGAIVVDLPIGFGTVFLGGASYYYYDNVYYRKVPTGYAVIAPLPMSSTLSSPKPRRCRWVCASPLRRRF